jgi:hypothetical protein
MFGPLLLIGALMVVAAFFRTIYEYVVDSIWYFRERRKFEKGGIPKAAKGLCPSCGYNATGNVSGICPECGKRLPLPFRLPPR